MRILRVAQKTYPDVNGGGAYHVHAMSRDQAEMGHEVTVLTVGDGPAHEDRSGYTVVRCASRLSLLGNDLAPGIWRHLRNASKYDIVHAHSHQYFSTNLAALCRWIDGVPLAITNHGLYSQSAPRWVFDWYLRTLGRWTFDAADIVFCYTDTEKEQLRQCGVNVPIEVIHNGINTERFTPDGSNHDAVIGDPAILFVGRLVKGKRPKDALEAFALVREELPGSGLTVCGEGPLQETLQTRATDLCVDDAVRFLGHVPYAEMPSVYRSADVLVLPSRTEGLPRTVLEALASETPVVTSDLPQLRGIADECGEMVPTGDRHGFAQALIALDDSSHRMTLGKRGRELIERRFLWENTVTETTTALNDLLNV